MTDSSAKKIKILFLAHNDNALSGHMRSSFEALPDELYDKRMVVRMSVAGRQPYAFESQRHIIDKGLRFGRRNALRLWQWIRGRRYVVDASNTQYAFLTDDDKAVSTKAILRKVKGFQPDVISLHWVANFLSAQTIRDLYDQTHAHFIFRFVDEQFLAGGCHYHCDCQGYLGECHDCPALLKGKNKAFRQQQLRHKLWSDIPKTIHGVPYDMEKALRTPHLRNAHVISGIANPKVTPIERNEARKRYGIADDEFVVFFGASTLIDKRKGAVYSMEAIRQLAETCPKVTALLLGKSTIPVEAVGSARIIQPGYQDKDGLMAAFCASDVFLSTTIADSGPYMVNYAFALGVPVVSFDLGVAHSLIEDGVTGFFAEYMNAYSVAQALRKVYDMSPDDRTIMSQKITQKIKHAASTVPWWKTFYQWWMAENR